MDSHLYADMLLNRCDSSMRLTLEAIDNVRELGEEKLWDKIESIYKDSNPIFVRRLRVYENEIKKGEMTSDFATKLKLDYKESEMEKATIWGHFEYEIIAALDTTGSDNRDQKSKLI